MHSQTSTQKVAGFDEIYARVPAEQVERLAARLKRKPNAGHWRN
jgi:hypothetical protein